MTGRDLLTRLIERANRILYFLDGSRNPEARSAAVQLRSFQAQMVEVLASGIALDACAKHFEMAYYDLMDQHPAMSRSALANISSQLVSQSLRGLARYAQLESERPLTEVEREWQQKLRAAVEKYQVLHDRDVKEI